MAQQTPPQNQQQAGGAQRPDPEAANTDETVQAEDRASSAVSGSGNTLGDGMTSGGGDRVEERKVFQQGAEEADAASQPDQSQQSEQADQAGGDRRYGGAGGKTANEEKGGEGDEDSASA